MLLLDESESFSGRWRWSAAPFGVPVGVPGQRPGRVWSPVSGAVERRGQRGGCGAQEGGRRGMGTLIGPQRAFSYRDSICPVT